MAMMTRISGIPARVAIGFLPGTGDGDTRQVRIRHPCMPGPSCISPGTVGDPVRTDPVPAPRAPVRGPAQPCPAADRPHRPEQPNDPDRPDHRRPTRRRSQPRPELAAPADHRGRSAARHCSRPQRARPDLASALPRSLSGAGETGTSHRHGRPAGRDLRPSARTSARLNQTRRSPPWRQVERAVRPPTPTATRPPAARYQRHARTEPAKPRPGGSSPPSSPAPSPTATARSVEPATAEMVATTVSP